MLHLKWLKTAALVIRQPSHVVTTAAPPPPLKLRGEGFALLFFLKEIASTTAGTQRTQHGLRVWN